jgi:signal transduction histidine kinase
MRASSNNWQQSFRLRLSLLAGAVIALLLLGLWWGDVFMNLRLRLMDIYFAPASTSDTIVIIAIDDDSLNRYGSTPSEWSRSVYVDLVSNLAAANPRVLAFDLLFSEIEAEDAVFAEALDTLGENEARTRIVLADAGINNLVFGASAGGEFKTLAFLDDLSLSPLLADQADYRGYTNAIPDIDSVVRRQPSLLAVNGNLEYSFGIAVYLAYLRIPSPAAQQVIQAENDNLLLTSERAVPVDENGLWQPYFFDAPSSPGKSAFPVISLTEIVDGNFDPGIFQDKIVLLGLMNTAGLLDQYLVPSSTSGNLMAGVEIQAHAVESILQNKFFKPLPRIWEACLIAGLAILSSVLLAIPRWYFKVLLLFGFLLLWFIFCSIVFSTSLFAIDLFDTMLALSLPFIISLGIDISLERWRRRQQEFLLESLQHIAEQRLHIEQAANYILADIQAIVPDTSSSLYLFDETQGYLLYERLKSAKGTGFSPEAYRHLQAPQTQHEQTIFPFVWQNQTLALLLISHPNKQRLSNNAEQLIQEFLSQLAPHMDNLLLHNAVERQKQLLNSIFAESPASIAIIDADGKIVQHNEDLSLLLASPETDLYGSSLPALLGKKSSDEGLLAKFQDGLSSNQDFSINEVKLDSSVLRIDVAPLRAYALWTVIIGDITSLVELNQLKTQMIRIVAHDLKNPLARIMGFSELLEMRLPDLDERNQNYLTFIQKASKDMLNIIEDTLNLERLRSGRVNLALVDFTPMVRDVCASHQPDTIQKQQSFDLEISDEAIYIKADFGQLSQAVTNLVGNAIKYTPDKGRVTVRAFRVGAYLRFEVEDTGYGIPKDAQEKLFTEFYRAKSDATAHIPGTGLGLSLVKSVIEAHDGSIGFKSEESIGSTFYFTLPVVEINTNDE